MMRDSRRPSTIPGLLLAGVLSLTLGCGLWPQGPSIKPGQRSVSVLSGGEWVRLSIDNDYDAEKPYTIHWTATGGTVDVGGEDSSLSTTWKVPYCIPEGAPLPFVTATITDAKGRTASAEFHFEESALFRCVGAGTASMSRPRAGHTATLLASGKVLVVGGKSEYTTIRTPTSTRVEPTVLEASAELYEPSTGTWASTGALSQPRTGHHAHLLPSGKVLVVGGISGWAENGYEAVRVTTVELYEPSTGTWTVASERADLRFLERSILLASGQVLMLGSGWNELYDPEANTWSPVTTHYDFFLEDALRLPSGRVLAVGRRYIGGPQPTTFPVAWSYDPATNSWASAGPLNAKDSFSFVVLSPLPSGQVLLIYFAEDGLAAELYDPEANTWTPTAAPSSEFVYLDSVTLLPTGKVLVTYYEEDSDWRLRHFDPATESWSVVGHMPVVVPANATVTPLPSGQILLVGGQIHDRALPAIFPKAEAWLYSPRTP